MDIVLPLKQAVFLNQLAFKMRELHCGSEAEVEQLTAKCDMEVGKIYGKQFSPNFML
jgi:hypothetical protein